VTVIKQFFPHERVKTAKIAETISAKTA
jgi:hypothetical protein